MNPSNRRCECHRALVRNGRGSTYLRSLSLPFAVFSRTLQLRPKGAVALAIATQPSWVAAQTGPRGFRRGKAQRTAIHEGSHSEKRPARLLDCYWPLLNQLYTTKMRKQIRSSNGKPLSYLMLFFGSRSTGAIGETGAAVGDGCCGCGGVGVLLSGVSSCFTDNLLVPHAVTKSWIAF